MKSVTIFKYYLPVILILALSVYILKYYEIALPESINNHFNDFLFIPIVLKVCQSFLRYLQSNMFYKLPLTFCLSVTIGYSVFFEIIIPNYNLRYTADLYDVFCYFFGLIFFLLVEKYKW